MRRLFHAGVVAASAQILAVTPATVAVTIAFRYGLVIPASGAAESELQSAARLLMLIYLFLAVGIALRRSRFINESAWRFREAARRFIRPSPILHAKLFSFSCQPLLAVLPFLLFARLPCF
jgi:hypothetical protein